MRILRLILRGMGYLFLAVFIIQVFNLYFGWFVIIDAWFMPSLYLGFGFLFILVLIDRLVSKEDHYYAKNVEK